MTTAESQSNTRVWQTRGAAGWLALSASPTFVLMAGVAAHHAHPIALCSSGSILSIDGMAAMYLLMSLFHLSPWLKLASACWWAQT